MLHTRDNATHITPLRALFMIMCVVLNGKYCRADSANPTESTAEMAAQIKEFIYANTTVPVDTRLEIRLDALKTLSNTHCVTDLKIRQYTPSLGIGNTSLVIECSAPKAWKAILPVTIRGIAQVVVANRSLVPGQTLSADDLTLDSLDISQLHNGYYTQINLVAGTLVKRAIRPSMPIYAHQLQAKLLIKRGEQVVLIGEKGPLTIRMMGVALKDGALGDTIQVRNSSSRRIIEGTVTRRQEVVVHL